MFCTATTGPKEEQNADRESIFILCTENVLFAPSPTYTLGAPLFWNQREAQLHEFTVCLNCPDPEEAKGAGEKSIAFNFFLCSSSSRSSL